MWPNKEIKIAGRKYRKKGKMPYSTKQYANPFFSKLKFGLQTDFKGFLESKLEEEFFFQTKVWTPKTRLESKLEFGSNI